MRAAASHESAAAQKLRRHREELQLALREGLPLAEARRRLHEQRMREIAAKRLETGAPPLPPGLLHPATANQPAYWWTREDL